MVTPSASRLPAHVWRAGQLAPPPGQVLASGHPALAAHLPGRGWPGRCLIELLAAQPGQGEATLLRPALARLAGCGPIVLVQPPHPPMAQAWQQGWPTAAPFWWVQAAHATDTLWAVHQALRSGACAAILAWLPNAPELALRRLHLAAQDTSTLLVVVRPWHTQPRSSPAPLRLGLQPSPQGLRVHFLKTRGLRPDHPILLPWPTAELVASATAPASPEPSDSNPAAVAAHTTSSC